MTFEIVTLNDLIEIRELQPNDWNDIVPDFEFYIKSAFCNPIKAVIDNTVVGIGTLIIFGNTSWIAHVIVRDNYRNKGVGLQIVNKLLQKSSENSIKTCSLIATELGKPIYLKAGFRKVTDYIFLKKEKPWDDILISKNVIPFDEKYRNEIYELDKFIAGENRKILLKDYLVDSILYIEQNAIVGYYLPNLKDGLIFSQTEKAGFELMKLKYSKVDNGVLPIENIVGLDFLKKNGFVETSKASRMIIGADIKWQPTKIYSRIGGNFG